MKVKSLTPGDLVKLKTKGKLWQGYVLDSHDPEVVLLKLGSGYNIGVRESDILDVKVLREVEKVEKAPVVLEKNAQLRNVALVITGGTISSRLDPKTGGVLFTGREEILKIAPDLKDVCNITRIEKPFMKWSGDMDYKDWVGIAKVCESLLNDDDVDGVIVTHGTDTLHYSAAALSFFLRDLNKPVALTYSQRSVDRGSTDASLNLLCAAKFAVSDIAEVALVGHEDGNDISCLAIPGTRTRKMHASVRGTFTPINAGPLVRITKDDFVILSSFNARDDQRKVVLDACFFDKVVTLKVHPCRDPSIIDYYVDQGYKGIVLEVTGLGHVPSSRARNSWLVKIRKALRAGVAVCAVPQTIFGRLNMNVYAYGRDLQKTGIIALEDMLSETALVKLGWVLGHKEWSKNLDTIKDKMLENIAGEISS